MEWVLAPDPHPPLLSTPDECGVRSRMGQIHALSEALRMRVEEALRHQKLPIVLGGDHTNVLGAFSGLWRHFCGEGGALGGRTLGTFNGLWRSRPDAKLGIVWCDAHPDLNTPATTPTHNAHGMPLAALLGYGHPLLTSVGGPETKLRPDQVVLVGVRSFDPGEAEFLLRHPEILSISAAEWQRDPAAAANRLLERVAAWDWLHLSIDLDVVDPEQAPGVTIAVGGGLDAEELRALVRLVLQSGKVRAVDISEYLPARDPDRRTARLAASLMAEVTRATAPAVNLATPAAPAHQRAA